MLPPNGRAGAKRPYPRPRPGAGPKPCGLKNTWPGTHRPVFHQPTCLRLAGARQLAAAVLAGHKRLDVFISNAGIGSRSLGSERQTSADGHELRLP